MRTREHEEIQDLLGVYAADAVDSEEAAEVERHLVQCAQCATEVKEHRETLALLAPATSDLRPRPFTQMGIDLSAPTSNITPLRRPARSVPAWTMSVAAAIVFLVAAVAVTQARRAEDLSDQLAQGSLAVAADRALSDPSARRLTLATAAGSEYADVAILEDGQAYLVPRDLPALSEDQTYQLWALRGHEKTSLVVAGARPGPVAFRTTLDIDGLALTQEVAGGAPQPTKTPVAVAFLRPA